MHRSLNKERSKRVFSRVFGVLLRLEKEITGADLVNISTHSNMSMRPIRSLVYHTQYGLPYPIWHRIGNLCLPSAIFACLLGKNYPGTENAVQIEQFKAGRLRLAWEMLCNG